MSTVNQASDNNQLTESNDKFAGLAGTDEMFAKLYADDFYKPFGDKMNELFGGKKLPNGESIIKAFRDVYDLGVAAGREIERRETFRKKQRKG